MSSPPQAVLVTGAQGNLGRKLVAALAESQWCERIVAVDRRIAPTSPSPPRVEAVEADLLDPSDLRWRGALAAVDAVVHLAATNPAPDSSWDEASGSFDMTAYLVDAAAEAGVGRVVFASSNHVMGQYKDPPLADRLEPGGLTTALTPGPGTRWFDGRQIVQGTAYAVSKLMGERLCLTKAALSGGALTAAAVRIGWCQQGENHPRTITANGSDQASPPDYPGAERDLRWFRQMWLSNRDFAALLQRAILADASSWPSPGIVVNGMSANAGMPWDIGETRRLLGYEPRDNVWDHLP